MDIESEINAMDEKANGQKVRCDAATFKGEIEF